VGAGVDRYRRAMLAGLAVALALTTPIPDPVGTTLPRFQGAPAVAHRMRSTRAPQHPYLAHDPRSNIHNYTWMTDAYRRRGPLGRSPRAFSGPMAPALCGSLTFHSKGYLVAVCPSIGGPPQARVIDPDTLAVLATYDMPNALDPPGTKAYQNFAGGGYFFLDGRDRIWSATTTRHLVVLHVAPRSRGGERPVHRHAQARPLLLPQDAVTRDLRSRLPVSGQAPVDRSVYERRRAAKRAAKGK
jgi:hypothetical protein